VRHTQGDYSGAERLYREALGMRRTLFGDEHTSVSEGMLNLAVVKSDQGDVRGAEAQYRRVLANDRRLFGATHEAIAVDLNNLGATLVVSDKCAEAKALLQESVDVNGRLYGADSPRLAPVLHNLSRALRCRGEWEQAESSSRRALALAVAMLGEHPNVDRVRAQLARILGDRGKLSDAKELARLVVANSRQRLPADHPWLADALLTLGQVLVSGGEAAEAERHFREAAALLEKRFGPGDWRAIEARVELAECLAKLGRPGAGADIAGSYPALVRALGPQHPLASRLRAAAGLSAVRRSGSG
jgi:tetratricopeptide (TPR) repeat protein